MESINKTIKNALHFISLVQDVCDKKRIYMEQKWNQEYNIFLAEWKQAHKAAEKKEPDGKCCVKMEQNNSCDLIAEEMEDLALADALLERARHIRTKSQNFLSGESIVVKKQISNSEFSKHSTVPSTTLDKKVSMKSILSSESSKCCKTAADMQSKKTLIKNLSECSRYKKVLPHSKSTVIPVCCRNSVVPRSKSGNLVNVPNKQENVQKNILIKNDFLSKECTVPCTDNCNISRTSQKCGISIVSAGGLNSFKEMQSSNCLHDKSKERNSGGCHDSLSSDLPQDAHQRHQLPPPSKKSFLNLLQSKSDCKRFLQFPKSGMWYPFLSSKNEDTVLGIECNSLSNLHKTSNLLHKIQETLLWIDLLCLIGRDILPSLLFLDENDINGIRVCSYFMSIFHETSQRIPMLHPSR